MPATNLFPRPIPFEDLTSAKLAEVATLRHEPMQPAVWDEATLWARAILPPPCARGARRVRAFPLVSLAATFDDVELRGEADGALAASIDEEIGLPYLVVLEAKRGIGATDPMAPLLGAMRCAARLNERDGHSIDEIYGCHTVADVWTFLRGTLSFREPKLSMSILSSREYTEKSEAPVILSLLESIVAQVRR